MAAEWSNEERNALREAIDLAFEIEADELENNGLETFELALFAALVTGRPDLQTRFAADIQQIVGSNDPDDLRLGDSLSHKLVGHDDRSQILTSADALTDLYGAVRNDQLILDLIGDYFRNVAPFSKDKQTYEYYRSLSEYCTLICQQIENRRLIDDQTILKMKFEYMYTGKDLESCIPSVPAPKTPAAQPPKSAQAQPKGTSAPAPKAQPAAQPAQPKSKPKPAAPPKPSITRLWPTVGPQEKKPPQLGALDSLGLLELHRKIETGAIGPTDLAEMRRKGTEGLLHHFSRAFKGSLIEKEATLLAEKLLLLGGESDRQAMACFLILNNYLGTSDRPFASLHSEADCLNGRTKSLERGIFDPRRFAGRSGRLVLSIGVSLLAALLLSVVPGLLDLQVLGMSIFGMAALGLCMATGLISGGLLNCGLHFALINLAAILGMGGDPATHVHRTVVWALLLTCLPMALRLLKAKRCAKQVVVLQDEIGVHLGEIDRVLACARALEKAVTPMFEQLKGHPAANADFVRDAQPGLERIRKEYKGLAADLGALRSKTDQLRKGE